jgi:signal transduction histidine kinase
MMSEISSKSLAIEIEIHDDIGSVRVDKVTIRQVLLNVLSSVVKFMPTGR